MEFCCAAASQNHDYYQQGYQYHDTHGDYSYSQVDDYDVDVQVEPTKCYRCEYTFLAWDNHEEGDRECRDPFSGHNVPMVECIEPTQACSVSHSSQLVFVTPSRLECAEYCDQPVCLSVGEHISGIAGPIVTKFCVQLPCGRGSVLLSLTAQRAACET